MEFLCRSDSGLSDLWIIIQEGTLSINPPGRGIHSELASSNESYYLGGVFVSEGQGRKIKSTNLAYGTGQEGPRWHPLPGNSGHLTEGGSGT